MLCAAARGGKHFARRQERLGSPAEQCGVPLAETGEEEAITCVQQLLVGEAAARCGAPSPSLLGGWGQLSPPGGRLLVDPLLEVF